MRERWLSSLLICGLLFVAHPTAQQPPIKMPQAPVRDAQGNYVFRWTDRQGVAREFVFGPANKISPTIHVTARRSAAGDYSYVYAITNTMSAEHKISSCSAEVALPSKIVGTPSGWYGGQPSQIVPRVHWFKTVLIDGVPDGISPGSTVTGFEITSPSLPGPTQFVCDGNVTPPLPPPDFPFFFRAQLDKLPIDDKRIVVLGIGPAIEKPDDPIPVLVRRIVRSYRVSVGSSRLPNAPMIVQALDRVRDDADRIEDLRSSLVALADLLVDSPDPWAMQLAAGLRECLAHVIGRLSQLPR